MNNIYNVFNVKSDLQLNNILNKLDLTPSEMISMDEIISGYGSIKDKRKAILEMMALSSENNYKLCEKYFSQPSNMRKLKEGVESLDSEMITPSHLNMNQAIQLNSLFELASKKFQEVNCSQAFYQMLSQKLSKNFANAFFNTLKSCDESSELKYNPELTIDGKNFAETIFPLVNELTNFLNGCKAEKKEEVKESIEKEISFDDIKEFAEKYNLIPTNKNEKANNKTYAKFITYPKSMNFNNFKKDALKKFGNNIEVIKGTKLKNNRFIVGIWYNGIDNGIDNLNESLEDTLKNFKYYVSTTSDKKGLEYIKEKLSLIFNECKNTEDRNTIAELLSQINTKLSSIKPTVEECCDIDTLLEPFKTTVVNITVNDNGDFVDCEKETAKQSLKALASHINDTKDCCQENNIENMETISSLLSSLARYFHKRICESVDRNMEDAIESVNTQIDDFGTYDDEYVRSCCEDVAKAEGIDVKKLYYYVTNRKWSVWDKDEDYEELDESYNEKYNDIREELNDIKQDYLNNELDVYDATNAVDNLIGNKSEAEAIVDSWDDPSNHGLYGITDDDLEEDTVYDHSWYEVKGQKYPKRTKNGVEIKEGVEDLSNVKVGEILLDNEGNQYIVTEVDTTYGEDKYGNPANYITLAHYNGGKAKGSLGMPSTGLKYIFHKENESMGDELNEGIKDWFKKDNRKYRIEMGTNGGYLSKDKKHIVGDKNDALIISGLKKAQKIADWCNNYEGITIYHPIEVNPDEEFYNQLMREPGMRNSEAEWIMKKNKSNKELDEDFKSSAKKLGRNIHKGLDKIHNATVKAGQKMGLGLSNKEMYDFFNEYLVYVFMFIYGKTTPDNDSFKGIYRNINGTDWNMENVHRFVMNMINNKNIMKQAKKDPDAVAKYMKYQLTHYGIDRKLIDRAWKTFEEEEKDRIDEMCSGGACCAGAVATIPSPVKPKTAKKKKKKSKVNEMALTMFKRHIIEGIDCQFDDDDNHYEYKNGYFYINGDIAKTTSKYYILESLDGQIELETLKGFNSEEMKLLEDIEANGNVGNEDEQNNSNNSDNPSNSNGNSQNGSNTDTNINKDNLGDVKQNITQDNDLTPEQRQLKKDTEKTLDQTMSGSNDVNVSVNQGMDNNNDQQTTNQSSSNIKYKLIGKDDSDKNNIKYIIQDPTTKETQIVDATKLRLEK